jgi:hypothetical protein
VIVTGSAALAAATEAQMDTSTKRTAGDEIRETSDARPGRDDSPRRDPGVTGPASPAPDRPEPASNPAPGIRHEPEPDAGNIMPAEDEPGTL